MCGARRIDAAGQGEQVLQPPDPGEILARDGSNLASVLDRLARNHRDIKETVVEYLSKVVPGIEGVDARTIGPKETLEFAQHVEGADKPWKFLAASMSDGTLRALGILVALLQSSDKAGVTLVGIEEPEVALHPAAAGILRDCLRQASDRTQVVVTSHSPDLLDDRDITPDALLAVAAEAGISKIGPLDEAGRTTLRDHLYTAGELLRLNQLFPDPEAVAAQAQLRRQPSQSQASRRCRRCAGTAPPLWRRAGVMRIGCIVEGHGEEQAVPILLRRFAELLDLPEPLERPVMVRSSRDKLKKPGELERAVELVARKLGGRGGTLGELRDGRFRCRRTFLCLSRGLDGKFLTAPASQGRKGKTQAQGEAQGRCKSCDSRAHARDSTLPRPAREKSWTSASESLSSSRRERFGAREADRGVQRYVEGG